MRFKGIKHLSVLVALIVTVGLLLPTQAQAQYRENGDDLALLFCSLVQANDTHNFRNQLRELRLRIRDIYSRIRCNNQSMIQFAATSNSYEIGRFIAHSVLPEDLRSSGDLNWVQQLNDDHPIADVVIERTNIKSQ